MNSGNSKTSDLHRLVLNVSDKIDLKRIDKYVTLWNLSIYYTWKKIKKSYKNIKLKISVLTCNNLNYLEIRNYWSSISLLWYCKQWLSTRFKSLVYIYSLLIFWSVTKYFTQKFYIFKTGFRIFIYWSMVYWSKL